MYAIIGGTGLNNLPGIEETELKRLDTKYGKPSGVLQVGKLNGVEVCFLARHGQPHSIPPHRINYRANIAALKHAGVTSVIAINAVGGIHYQLGPALLSVPDQIIDYTSGREHTIYDGSDEVLDHIDFTGPYTQSLRKTIIACAKQSGTKVLPCGTYAATNGPRLESAAEVIKIKQDGGDMIGMTGMPEAALAREMGLEYACIAVSVNWGAGLHTLEPISLSEIASAMEVGMKSVNAILAEFFAHIDG